MRFPRSCEKREKKIGVGLWKRDWDGDEERLEDWCARCVVSEVWVPQVSIDERELRASWARVGERIKAKRFSPRPHLNRPN